MDALQVLEWARFLEYSKAEARTEPGKLRIGALADPANWAGDLAAARLMQQETQETSALLDRDGLWGPLVDLTDPEAALERLERGSVLEISELVLLRRWLYAVDSWSLIPRDEIRGELFKKSLNSLPDPFEPLRVLGRVLTPEGELSEKASPKLATLFSEIRGLKREIGVVLDQLIKTFSQKGILQENFSDVRDGRYVIPVKISSQGEIDGIIYEASASRQTVFVEPKEVGQLNNRLRQRQNDLIQEIYIVLEDTSKRLQPFAVELRTAVEVLTHWDSVQARARTGRHYSGKPIEVTEERHFLLHQTAHPLLWHSLPLDNIIRNEIDFGEKTAFSQSKLKSAKTSASVPSSNPVKTLLLTGPNTGGKTVLLKTLGLAGLCARTGFPFPATDRPEVPFFDTFFADLGDPQSIEQHLSSFSGHILRFKEILAQVTPRSLVLIDELNTATDPEEGAALGRAFLETVMAKGALLVATTHDPQLKALSVSDSRILNASMAFDEGARTPTYRLVLGVPGRSRALETAERLGIPSEVLELAKKYISREHIEFESLLSRLESDSAETARARKEAVAIREEAERLKKEWTEKTESSVNEMLERTRQRLRRILEQAQDEVRTSVKRLDEMKTRREVDQTRTHLNQSFAEAASHLETALAEEAPEIAEVIQTKKSTSLAGQLDGETYRPPALEVGGSVRVPKWKSIGTVVELKGEKIKVAIGTVQMTLSIGDVEAITKTKSSGSAVRTKVSGMTESYSPPAQLDLRGTRFDDAMSQLGQYLDLAFRSGTLVEVTVVHGLGTGALREGTRKLLGNLPYVKSFRDGGAGHGGSGATIVEFERD